MQKNRILALLLALALLWTATGALGEDLDIDLADDALQLESGEAVAELEGPVVDILEDALVIELPDDSLDGELSEADATDAAPKANGERVVYYRPGKSVDNDALFAGYVDSLFGQRDRLGLKRNGFVGDQFKGMAAKMYKNLLKQVGQVASGKLTSTKLSIPIEINSDADWNEAANAFNSVCDALLMDCPYDLYWYDKTNYTEFGYNNGLYIKMPVAKEYAKSTYVTNATKIKSAQVAVTNAKKVVKKYAGVSDYKKLCGYRDYICNAVTYNDAAAENASTPYGNPWQVIWVFDGNAKTNVVCEGYAKAFQYLCDLSSFSGSVQSHIVTGSAGGPHMWNIVTMEDGKNYHVDITFCDGGFGEAFLAGTTSTSGKSTYCIANEQYYTFDSDTLSTYAAKVLKLATKNYNPDKPKPTAVSITQGSSATLYMGNTLALATKLKPANAATTLTWSTSNKAVATVSSKGVVTPKKAGTAKITVRTANKLSATITVKVVDAKSVSLKKGGTTLKKGKTLSVKRGKSVTLTGVVSPAKVKTTLTWKSSNKNVTVKNGKVTVSAKAKAGAKVKITVTTTNGKSTYIYIKVK